MPLNKTREILLINGCCPCLSLTNNKDDEFTGYNFNYAYIPLTVIFYSNSPLSLLMQVITKAPMTAVSQHISREEKVNLENDSVSSLLFLKKSGNLRRIKFSHPFSMLSSPPSHTHCSFPFFCLLLVLLGNKDEAAHCTLFLESQEVVF